MAKRKITMKFAKEYACVSKKRTGQILDAIFETNSWSRNNARRRQLRRAAKHKTTRPAGKRRIRPPKYSSTARQILTNLWAISGQSCGLYIHWQIKEGLIEWLVRFGALRRGPKNKGAPLARSTTRPVSYVLRNEIHFDKSYTAHTDPRRLFPQTR